MIQKSKSEYLKELQDIAEYKEGKLLSLKYTNLRVKYSFECKDGHKFWRYPQEIKRGRWCKICVSGI